MDRYVGLDPHPTSCTFGVMGPSGKRLKSMVVETNGAALVVAVAPENKGAKDDLRDAWARADELRT